MPNQVKIDIVDKSASRLKEASGIYFTKYTGMNVIQDTKFRKICREKSVEYSVTKNTLIKIAAKNAGYESIFDEILEGQIGIATSIEDPIAPAPTAPITTKINPIPTRIAKKIIISLIFNYLS